MLSALQSCSFLGLGEDERLLVIPLLLGAEPSAEGSAVLSGTVLRGRGGDRRLTGSQDHNLGGRKGQGEAALCLLTPQPARAIPSRLTQGEGTRPAPCSLRPAPCALLGAAVSPTLPEGCHQKTPLFPATDNNGGMKGKCPPVPGALLGWLLRPWTGGKPSSCSPFLHGGPCREVAAAAGAPRPPRGHPGWGFGVSFAALCESFPSGGCGVAPGGCWERSAGERGHALRHGVRAPGAEPLADGSGLGLRGAGVGFGRRPFERGRAVSCEPRRLSRARLGSRDLVAPSERSAFLYF